MYPDLLPSDYKKQLQYPNPVPLLSGAELEKAHLALIDYLTQVRSQFIRLKTPKYPLARNEIMSYHISIVIIINHNFNFVYRSVMFFVFFHEITKISFILFFTLGHKVVSIPII